MMVEKAVYALLSGAAGLVALVSARIYPVIVSQGEPLPAVIYLVVSKQSEHCMGLDSNLTRARVQVTAFASTQTSARSVADAIKSAMSRKRGTYGGVSVDDVLFDNETSFYSPDALAYQINQDFTIFYRG